MASPDLTSAEPVGGDAPQQVTYETLDEGRIARIWLNRPEAQNAQSRTLLVQLDEAFGRAEADDAVRVVAETRRCSTSWLQRKLGLGYNRAARLLEQMEQSGLVSAMSSNGNRDILVPARDSD